MQQLSGLDTVFLNLETEACPMHVGGLAILDLTTAPENFGRAAVLEHVRSRLDLIPPLRRRLLTTPFNLDHPYWIEDPDFRLEQHVLGHRLPAPGDERQLAELVCELAARPLDRSRPLWELHYVDGLAGGRAAMITKIHHAAIDGVSGAEIMGNLLDLSATPRRVPAPAAPWQPDAIPSPNRLRLMTAKSLLQRPQDTLRLLRGSVPALFSAGRQVWAQRRAGEGAEIGGASLTAAPRTRFNQSITAERSYAFGSLPLDEVKRIKNAFGTSVNDVVMAVCAGAVRRYLEEKDELPASALIAGIPVSVRSEEQKGAAGNQVKFTRASLATHIADPVERLRQISAAMARFKQSQQAMPANLMGDWAELPAPALMARAARLYQNFSMHNYHAPAFNLVISNVPGPPVPLYLAGARLLANYPVSIPYHGLGFNVTVLSYMGKLDLGLTAHRGCLPDSGHMLELLEQALAELADRARQAA